MANSISSGRKEGINLLLKQFADVFVKAAYFYAAKMKNSKGKDLSDSDLLKSLKVEVDDEKLTISVYYYYVYVANGRRKGAKPPPTDVILTWIKKNKLKGRDKKGKFISDTALSFIISRAIAKNGIKARPFLNVAYEETQKEFEKLLDGFLDDFLNDILIRFTSNK